LSLKKNYPPPNTGGFFI